MAGGRARDGECVFDFHSRVYTIMLLGDGQIASMRC